MKNGSVKMAPLLIGLFYLMTLPSLVAAKEVDCDFRQVSQRIHVMVGSDHKTCSIKAIEHPLTNPAIVVGDSGVVVIDPGGSLQIGRDPRNQPAATNRDEDTVEVSDLSEYFDSDGALARNDERIVVRRDPETAGVRRVPRSGALGLDAIITHILEGNA